MAVIGYARVSTTDQNPQLQLDALQEAGATRIYTDHGVSGATAYRPTGSVPADARVAHLRCRGMRLWHPGLHTVVSTATLHGPSSRCSPMG